VTGSTRRMILLGGLAVAVVAAVTLAREDAPSTTAAPVRPGRNTARTPASKVVPVVDLKIGLLHEAPAEAREVERNLFRFASRPVAAPQPASRRPAVRAVAPAVAPPSQPTTPPIPLRYIGLLDAPGQAGRVAILSDGQGHVFYGKEGDTIEGRYVMLQVGPISAELSYLDGRGRQTIRLAGQ